MPYHRSFRLLLSLSLLTPFVLQAAESKIETLAKEFFTNPLFMSFRLSPNGTYLAYRKQDGDRMAVCIMNLKTKKAIKTDLQAYEEISSFGWEDDETVVIKVSGSLYAMNGRTEAITPIITYKNARNGARVVSYTPLVPGSIIACYTSLNGEYDNYYEVDTNSGPRGKIGITDNSPVSQQRLIKNDGSIRDVFVDDKGIIRFIEKRPAEDQPFSWHYRENADQPYRDLHWPLKTVPLSLLEDQGAVLVSAYRENECAGLYIFDLNQNDFTKTLIYKPPYDFLDSNTDVLVELGTWRVIGFHSERQKPFSVYVDPIYAALHKKIADVLPGKQADLLGILPDGVSGFVFASSDRFGGAIYHLDLAKGKLDKIVERFPNLKEDRMRPVEPIQFNARDGTTIYGYLTKPMSLTDGPYPMVVLVHGGPMVRDSWGFDPEVQFYAALGYAVLQVNFRGSSGYGRTYEGDLVWACRHGIEDVADGTRWAIEQKIADPSKIAVYGFSFGGYAALAGAAFEPDLYRCVIGGAGVYDWELFIEEDNRRDWMTQWMEEFYGLAYKTPEILRPFSPVYQADKIKCPVLLLHGKSDSRVETKQTKVMHASLKAKGNCEARSWNWIGHGLGDEETRIEWHTTIGEFLARHMPVGSGE